MKSYVVDPLPSYKDVPGDKKDTKSTPSSEFNFVLNDVSERGTICFKEHVNDLQSVENVISHLVLGPGGNVTAVSWAKR